MGDRSIAAKDLIPSPYGTMTLAVNPAETSLAVAQNACQFENAVTIYSLENTDA
jgi:hypothetical protein